MTTFTSSQWDDRFTIVEHDLYGSVRPTGPMSALYDATPHTVWTLLDVDGVLTVVPGLHVVNRFGYIVTEEPWEEADRSSSWLWEENECEGHESLDGAHMGETVFCDGSCS